MKRLLALFAFACALLTPSWAAAAQRHWVGGTNNWNSTAGTKWALTNGGAGGQTVPGTGDDVFFDSGSGNVTVTLVTVAAKSIDCTGFTGTLAGSANLTVSGGGWTFGAGMTNSWTGTATFADTSGTTQSITSNGIAFAGPIIFNGVGGVWQLGDAFSSTSTVTLTNGSFSTNTKNVTTTGLISSNSNTRTLTITNSALTLTGTGSVFTIATDTNLTFAGSGSTMAVTDASATSKTVAIGTKTIGDVTFSGAGSGSYTLSANGGTMRDLIVSNTGGATTANNGAATYRNINFTGSNDTWGNGSGTATLTGNLTLASGMTASRTTAITFAGTSGTQTITSAGATINAPLTFDGVGGTFSLGDDFVSTTTGTLTNGTFTLNGHSGTFTTFAASNSNVRTLNIANGTLVLSGTGTPLNISTQTNLTLVTTGSTIKLNDASASAKTFAGGGNTWGTLWLTGAGSGAFTISNSSTYDAIRIDTGPKTVHLTAGSTQTLVGSEGFHATGSAGNLITVDCTTPGGSGTLSKAGGWSVSDYLSVTDVTGTGGARWFMGSNSTNVSHNIGLRFTGLALAPLIALNSCGTTPSGAPTGAAVITIGYGPGDSTTHGGFEVDTNDAWRGPLYTLLQADVASHAIDPALIPNGIEFRFVGPRVFGNPPTDHFFGARTTQGAVLGEPSFGTPIFSDYFGAGKTGGQPDIFIPLIGHNDSLAEYEDGTTGIIPLIMMMHSTSPSARFVFGDPQIMFDNGYYDPFWAYNTSTALPYFAGQGLSVERFQVNLGNTPGDVGPNGHPTAQGQIHIANIMHTAVLNQVIRVLGGTP